MEKNTSFLARISICHKRSVSSRCVPVPPADCPAGRSGTGLFFLRTECLLTGSLRCIHRFPFSSRTLFSGAFLQGRRCIFLFCRLARLQAGGSCSRRYTYSGMEHRSFGYSSHSRHRHSQSSGVPVPVLSL